MPLANDIIGVLRDQRTALVDLVVRLASIESPSQSPDHHMPLVNLLREALDQAEYRSITVPDRLAGGRHIFAAPRQRSKGRPFQILLGHFDTVWPLGTVDTMPVRVDEDIIYGPGVFDMKAGLAQTVFALRTLRVLGATPSVTPVIFFNADEETGSRDSTKYISRLARGADRAFVMEPALGTTGHIKTERKGVGRYTVHIHGEAAHAGLEPERGLSAIVELSHVIQRLHSLNDVDRGVSVNVGTIDGGSRTNVVAEYARADVDVRVPTREDAIHVDAEIRAITPTAGGITITVEGRIGRPPMRKGPRSQLLWESAVREAMKLGITLDEERAGGGSDGNTTSQFTATLDGLGAVGDGAHARHEFVFVDRLVERCALLALLILQPPLQVKTNGQQIRTNIKEAVQ